MDAPPSYTDIADLEGKFPPSSQQPQIYSAFTPGSTHPSAVQPDFSQAQPVPGHSNIFAIGSLSYESVQTRNGVQMIGRVLGKIPSTLLCQFCDERMETKVEEGSLKEMLTDSEWRLAKCTWIMLLVLSPLGLFIPLCVYCKTKPLSLAKHTCPRCNTCLGIHHGEADYFFYTAGSPEAQYAAGVAMMRSEMTS